MRQPLTPWSNFLAEREEAVEVSDIIAYDENGFHLTSNRFDAPIRKPPIVAAELVWKRD